MTEKLFLTADSCLNHCGDPLSFGGDKEKILSYASFAAEKMLHKYIKGYDRLKIPVFEGIFSGKKSVPEITRKKYAGCSQSQIKRLMSCVFLDMICSGKPVFIFPVSFDDRYSLLRPERIIAELKGDTDGIGKKIKRNISRSALSKRSYPFVQKSVFKMRGKLLLKIGAAVMKSSVNERTFVKRFNQEKFFRKIDTEHFSPRVSDFCEKNFMLDLAALYAITFLGLSFRDIYTVDEVFGFSDADMDIRSKDDIKGEAAFRMISDIEGQNDEDTAQMLIKMGEELLKLPLPEIDSDNAILLAEKYPFYCAAADIGDAYIRASDGNRQIWLVMERDFQTEHRRAAARARLLSQYRDVVRLCEEIVSLSQTGGADISEAKGIKKAKLLENEVKIYG